MPRYHVGIREVHVNTVVVIADSEEQALRKAADDELEDDELEVEYSHTLDPDVWTVEKVED